MNILVASSVCPKALEYLRERHDVVCAFNAPEDDLKRLIKDRDALVFRSGVQISAGVMSCAPNLKLLIRAGSGLDNLDVDYAASRGIELVRVPEPGAQAVAELTFGLMLALVREILVADRQLRNGHWIKGSTTGYLLRGKVLGVVGAGNIGTRVGEMGAAWGMEVIGCVENPPALAERNSAQKIRLTDLEQVLTTADFVSIHVPLTDSTRNLIGAEELASMKPGSFLVNMSRGGVVDEDALLNALSAGKTLAGAALDVHQREGEGQISPLASLPNVVLTPHIGATTIDTQREIGQRVIRIVESFECQGLSEPGRTNEVSR